MASAMLLLGKYLLVLLFPHPLGSDFGYNQIPLTDWSDVRVWAAFLTWTGLLVWALAGWRRRRLLSFGILFFAVNFSLYTNLLVTIGTSYGERLLYAASPGFALLLALTLAAVFRVPVTEPVPGRPGRKGFWAATGILLLLYGYKTVDRNQDWKDSFSLYAADVPVAPDAAKLNYHFGLELVQRGLEETDPSARQAFFDRGQSRFERAVRIYPAYHDAYSQLGLVYYRRKDYGKAMELYELALRHKPNFALVYSNMGIIFFERGELDKAREVYEKAVSFDPRMKDALRNLGAVHAMQGNFGEAIRWFSQGLEYWPDDPTLNQYLGSAYRDAGQPEKGRPYMEKARRLDPNLR
jgi:tetratricopeptide (TPR) repeat protein